MKRKILLILLSLSFSLAGVDAQVSSYTFSQSVATYTPIAGGTTLGIPDNDDDVFAALPIGFNFCYNSIVYNTFGVNANGWITFGSGAVTNSYTALSTGVNNNVVAGFNFDIQGDLATGNLQYQTSGVAPNQVLTIQWTDYDAWQSAANTDIYNFQIKLYETTNNIEVVYGNFVCNVASRTGEVGLRGSSNADFNNRLVINGTNTWATSIAGAFNNSTCQLTNLPFVPTSGTTFTWTPPSVNAPVTVDPFTGITTTGMTLNWTENSTGEVSFLIERSIDNIIFTPVAIVPSITSVTIGNPYNYVATGLFSNTLYYWRVTPQNAACGNPFTPGQQTTLSGTLCGTYSVGPTGAYPSITAAIADVVLNGLACPCNFELQAAYLSAVETFPINIPFLGSGPGTSITVRPEFGATNLALTTGASNTVVFNGATYFGFDGRPGGIGTSKELIIVNSATGFSALAFINDGANSGANYVKIQGVTTGIANGVVNIGNNATTAGKTNLYINNSAFIEGLTNPTQYILSTNAIANSWVNMTLNNNTFEDWFSGTTASNAINVAAGNRGWNISNNKFYQTVPRTELLAATHNIVLISTTTASSGGNTIANNKFGGIDSTMSGYYTISGAVASRFNVINATGNTSFAVNNITGNTIKNFNFTTTAATTASPGIWSGIFAAGTTNNMNISNNIIGSSTTSDSIMVTTSGTGGISYGITCSATGINIVNANQVGGLKLYGSAPTVSTSCVGINVAAGSNNTITNNLVGSTLVVNNIRNNLSTNLTAGRIDGIYVAGTTHTITGNTVSGITNFYSFTAATGAMRGIFINSGIHNTSNNTVSRLATLATQINAVNTPSIVGIYSYPASNGNIMANNIVTNLYNVAPTAAATVVMGIGYNGFVTVGANNIIRNNQISNLGALQNTGAAPIIGIDLQVGNAKVYNNFVDLGLDILTAPIVAPNSFIGLNKTTAASGSFLFNSVRIAGTGVNGAATNTFAFRRTTVGATDTVKANIFTNFRSNGTSTGKHYLTSLNNNTTITLDRNVYFGNGTGYVFGSYGGVDVTNLPNWVSTTVNDVNSFFANPGFISATNLHINGAIVSIVESRAVGVTSIPTDIDGDTRPGPVGSVNGGGTDPDIGADEVDAFPVTTDVGISLLVQPPASGCHGSNDSVIVRLKNYATTAAIDFAIDTVTINSSVAGPNPLVFPTIVLASGTLAGNATMDIVVATGYDMTALGTYTFNASATTPLDFINSNDAMPTANIIVDGGIVTVSSDQICALDDVTLNNAGATNGGTFQWEISQDGIAWSNIPAATSNPYVYTDASTAPDTLFFRTTSCGLHTSTTDTVIVTFVNSPTANDTSRCGPGFLDLNAIGIGLSWYDAPIGGTFLDTGSVYTPFLNVTDTFYVASTSGGGAPTMMPLPAQTTTFTGNVRGMWFTAPVNFTINGLQALPGGAGLQNITVVRFNPAVPPPAFPGTTNAFTTLYLTQNDATVGIIPVNIPIIAGDVIGIMSQRGNVTSYAPGPFVTNIDGTPMTITRMGMQLPLATNPPQTLWQEAGGSIGRTEIYYTTGCESVRTPVVATVIPAAPVNAYVASGGVTCDNEVDTLIATSPNTSYDYTWSPSTGLQDSSAAITAANPQSTITYYLHAIDTANCQNFDTVTVVVNPSPVINLLSSDSVICYGDTANLYLVMGPYFYTDSTNVTVPDANLTGINSDTLVVNGISSSMTASTIDSVCFNMTHTWDSDMAFWLVSPGGTQMLLMAAEGGAGDNFTGTCFKPTAVVPIVGAAVPFTGTFIPEDPLGFGAFNGENGNGNWYLHMVDDAGGDIGILQDWSIWFTAPNYSFSWNSSGGPLPDTTSSISVNPLTTTSYYLSALDTANGCSKTDTIVLAVYDPLDLNPYASPIITCNGNDTLVANASGGSGNYTYFWSDGLGTNDSALVVGIPFDYTVGISVTDVCGALTDSVLIDFVDPMNVTVTDTSNCGPDSAFVLSSIITGGNGVYDYSWAPTADTTNSITTGTVSSTTSYTLTVTDGCGTVDSDVATVTINTPPTVNLGADIVQLNPPATLDAGPGFTSYLWSTSAATQTINVTTNGTYWVMVTDANGCTDYDTIQVNFTSGINNPDGSVATVSYYPNPTDGIVNVSIQGFLGEDLKLEVTDLQGRVIRNYTYSEVTESFIQTLDLSSLRAGTYLLVLRSNDDVYTNRIVITTDY